MAVFPLSWKDGEGYDIHVLRNLMPSKALDSSFDFQFSPASFALVFAPYFKGAPNAQGVRVDTATGVVTASPGPTPKLRNFLMAARQNIGTGDTAEATIRIHLHQSIKKLWLTPSTLTCHTNFDECRFTVLAQFEDDVVGDITDWPQITFSSADKNSVDVLPGGILSAIPGRPTAEMEIEITATLKLATPATNLSATAKAVTSTNWRSLGRHASVRFVDGPIRVNPQDMTDPKKDSRAKPNSVPSVVQARTNILFISEGFLQSQQHDFDTEVASLIQTGLRDDILQPFKLLKDSINYWSLFVPSNGDGISLLGDYSIGPKQRGSTVPRPEVPVPGAQEWSVANMIHQLGLPAPKDPAQSIADWVRDWKKLYDAPVTVGLVTANFSDWDALRSRSPLNERDSVFGFAYGMRSRVSDSAGGDALLRPAPRRTTEGSIDTFIGELHFGVPPPGDDSTNIGQVWEQGGKDRGLVCFVCMSDLSPGEARDGYFAAATGYEMAVNLIAAAKGGTDFKTAALSDPQAPYSSDIFASRVAHECGHALGLGDEYGPGGGAMFMLGPSGTPPMFPNLQAIDEITSAATTGSGPQTVFHPDKIKWLLPRAIKVGVIGKAPTALAGRQNFQITMAPGQGAQFAAKDLVLMRRPPLNKSDPFSDLRFVVDTKGPDTVDVHQTSGPPLDVNRYDTTRMHVLICASGSANPGVELKLIADPVLKHISTSGGPLTGVTCVASKNAAPFITPSNLPRLKFKKPPPTMADVVGIYEGGGHFDCGILRPAGRCKMRAADDKVVPFCQVCRYIMVDRVDATKLAILDTYYDPYYPI